MDFVGSKKRLLTWIHEHTLGHAFIDGCCGSGIVSQYMASQGKTVWACDLLYFPGVIIRGTIGITATQKDQAADFLTWANQNIKGTQGFFYNNYTGERLYFTHENAAFLDQLRIEINNIKDNTVKDYVLYCGMEALSRACNICGIQSSFLKKLKKPAREKIELRLEKTYEGMKVEFYRGDVLDLIDQSNHVDTIYIDPPYNERQYGKHYHIYETFIRNDDPELKGVTGQRTVLDDPSDFCRLPTYEDTFQKVITAARRKSKRVLISYNSEGNLKKQKFIDLGATCHERVMRRYKADSNRNNRKEPLIEYLFVI